jgi:hypothetical protein
VCDSPARAALHGFVVVPFSLVPGLPGVASRPVQRSFLEPRRQGEVGSFRRRGEVRRLVGVYVLARLDGNLKTGSHLWINLLEGRQIFLGVFPLAHLNV